MHNNKKGVKHLELFSINCCKTETKVIITANQKKV